MPTTQQFAEVNGKRIAYLEAGAGDPIVLHGNPTLFCGATSSRSLRHGRVIAPDLIGQGDSEKLPASEGVDRYSFEVAFDYLDGLLHELDANQNITLVIHDWGSGLGFHWARHNPESVKGIAYAGSHRHAHDRRTGRKRPGYFSGIPLAQGRGSVLERNMFVEAVLPSSIIRTCQTRKWLPIAPFDNPEDRQPTLNWPRQIPINGEPLHMVELVDAYGAFMANTDIPKLFINADPGSILVGKQRDFAEAA